MGSLAGGACRARAHGFTVLIGVPVRACHTAQLHHGIIASVFFSILDSAFDRLQDGKLALGLFGCFAQD